MLDRCVKQCTEDIYWLDADGCYCQLYLTSLVSLALCVLHKPASMTCMHTAAHCKHSHTTMLQWHQQRKCLDHRTTPTNIQQQAAPCTPSTQPNCPLWTCDMAATSRAATTTVLLSTNHKQQSCLTTLSVRMCIKVSAVTLSAMHNSAIHEQPAMNPSISGVFRWTNMQHVTHPPTYTCWQPVCSTHAPSMAPIPSHPAVLPVQPCSTCTTTQADDACNTN